MEPQRPSCLAVDIQAASEVDKGMGISSFSQLRNVAIGFSLSLCLAMGCGPDDVGNGGDLVGGSCDQHADCVGECVKGGDFPNGTCTVSCDEDNDCPSGTACVDKDGGVCLLVCRYDDECRSNYSCKSEKRKGHGGDTDVCID